MIFVTNREVSTTVGGRPRQQNSRAGRVVTEIDLVVAVGVERGCSHSFAPFQSV